MSPSRGKNSNRPRDVPPERLYNIYNLSRIYPTLAIRLGLKSQAVGNDKDIFNLKLLLGLIFWEKFNYSPITLVSPFYATH
ncbi:MAG: hypothetical protein KME54_23420 [Tolypothrix brevis GSE-NOS-MK-07-07A]|nr:hypothetical protein [Tolypothrix brevis GSE-NOS-MK-07-07A]